MMTTPLVCSIHINKRPFTRQDHDAVINSFASHYVKSGIELISPKKTFEKSHEVNSGFLFQKDSLSLYIYI